jgi:transposase
MSNLYWLSDAQMERLKPFFPKSHGKPRVDDRRVLSGIIFINRNGLRWCDAPKEYGPAKTLYNRWKRWSDNGVFARIMVGLAAESADHKTIMIDATYLKAHRTASSLRAWAAQVARRRGRRRAMVALARRIGVILHRMWRDGTVFWIEPSVTSHAA